MVDTHRADSECASEADADTGSAMAAPKAWHAGRWPVLIRAIARPKAAAEWVLGAPWAVVVGAIVGSAALMTVIVLVVSFAFDVVVSGAIGGRSWEALRAASIVAGLSTLSFVMAVAAFNLPYVDRSGPLGSSIARSVRIAAALWLPAILLILIVGVASVFSQLVALGGYGVILPDPELVIVIGAFVSVLILVVLNALALRTVQDHPASVAERSPLCEFCGYSLVHQPDDARCPECGRLVRDSLDMRCVRLGSAWARNPGADGYITTTFTVLFRPRSFYRDLRLHTPLRQDRGFAAVHYVVLMLAAAATCTLMVSLLILREGNWSTADVTLKSMFEFTLGMLMIGVGCVFVSVLGQRVLLLVMYIFWRMCGMFPCRDAVAKIATYEVAFQWAYWVWLGLWVSSIMLFDTWLSNLLGLQRMNIGFSWFLIEEIIIIGGLFGLTLLWIIRMQLAARAIRWANF